MNLVEHLLTIAGEEGAEVTQRASKALRFSVDEIQPGQPDTNAERLIREFWDLCTVMRMLRKERPGAFALLDDEGEARKHFNEKWAKVEKFLDYSRKQGTLP